MQHKKFYLCTFEMSGGEVFCGRSITRTRAALSVLRLQPLISSTASMHYATIILPDEEKKLIE